MATGKINQPIFLITGLLAILANGFFALLTLTEFYQIAILKHTGEYPFGSEGPAPYYYKSAGLYSIVNLVWGLVFLLPLAFATRAMLKRQERKTAFAFLLTALLLLILFIHGQIGT